MPADAVRAIEIERGVVAAVDTIKGRWQKYACHFMCSREFVCSLTD
jgi:hypothetical protein